MYIETLFEARLLILLDAKLRLGLQCIFHLIKAREMVTIIARRGDAGSGGIEVRLDTSWKLRLGYRVKNMVQGQAGWNRWRNKTALGLLITV